MPRRFSLQPIRSGRHNRRSVWLSRWLFRVCEVPMHVSVVFSLLPYHFSQHRAEVFICLLHLVFHGTDGEVVYPSACDGVEYSDTVGHGDTPRAFAQFLQLALELFY